MAYWGDSPEWQRLNSLEKAAAMALLEADNRGGKVDLDSARNALGAMINRADKEGQDLGQHVSGKIYQPTIEDAQRARLPRILASPEFTQLQELAKARLSGAEPDWVNGATHFLAPEKTMLALEAQDPGKYKNWGPRGRNWTGYDPDTGEYKGVVMRDASHAFLAPEGTHSANFGGQAQPQMVASTAPPGETSIAKGSAPAQYSGGFGSLSPEEVAQALSGKPQAVAQAPTRSLSVKPDLTEEPLAIPKTMLPRGYDKDQAFAQLVARLKTGKLGA